MIIAATGNGGLGALGLAAGAGSCLRGSAFGASNGGLSFGDSVEVGFAFWSSATVGGSCTDSRSLTGSVGVGAGVAAGATGCGLLAGGIACGRGGIFTSITGL